MSTQVQRLEELLERVQRNRNKPRVRTAAAPAVAGRAATSEQTYASAASPVSEEPAARQPRPDLAGKPVAREGVSQPAAGPAPPAKYPTPFEAAVEEQLAAPRPASQPPPPASQPPPPPPASQPPPPAPRPASQPPAPAPEPAQAARMTPGRPLRITPAELMRAAGAVASVVSQHPESEPVTFGALLRRTLSLRPR